MSMKTTSILFVTLGVVIALAGCGKKPEVSSQANDTAAPASTTETQAQAPTSPEQQPAEEKIVIKDKKVGKGSPVETGDEITVHYKGWLDDGTVFDTSMQPDREPFSFVVGVGQVIQGWEEGVIGMKVGGVRELTIPSSKGYGPAGQGAIPPNATLHFEIKLLKISKPGPPPSH